MLFRSVCETNQMVNALALAVVERILWNAAKFDDAGKLAPIVIGQHQVIALDAGDALLP